MNSDPAPSQRKSLRAVRRCTGGLPRRAPWFLIVLAVTYFSLVDELVSLGRDPEVEDVASRGG